MIPAIECSACHRKYPEHGFAWHCESCGGVFDLPELAPFDSSRVAQDRHDLWKYRAWLPLEEQAAEISLGEGGTPLVPLEVMGRPVWGKAELLNPTGSFKDRATAVLVSVLKDRGVSEAVEDSSGNAGASFAAYCARAGIRARIYVPGSSSGLKRTQIAAYGAEVRETEGGRSAASEAALREVQAGVAYGSHAYLPHGLGGIATIAFELVSQLGSGLGLVAAPAGQGSLITGLFLGFQSLLKGRLIRELPRLVAVQIVSCAPIWKAWQPSAPDQSSAPPETGIAEGIRVARPVRMSGVIRALEESQGDVIAVDEREALLGQREWLRQGMFVETTSAVVYPAIAKILGGQSRLRPEDIGGAIVAILTGSGLKEAGRFTL
ncbi:MAG: pyridoxal-phosphate dependent enzyme [Anaerolineales bacterium]|jgi:threonine synthase